MKSMFFLLTSFLCLLILPAQTHCQKDQVKKDSQGADPLPPSLPDPCAKAKAGAARINYFAKDTVYILALKKIINAFRKDGKEHAMAFGRGADNNFISSGITEGNSISGNIPVISNGFADLHNHPNSTPPDAGDLYGLIDINQKKNGYDTRFVVTLAGTVYALLVTEPSAAAVFNIKYPRQPPAFRGGPPGFPILLVDEFREIKYKYNCTDEMVMSFMLEKYNAGVCLFKQDKNGIFKKLITTVSADTGHLIFTSIICP